MFNNGTLLARTHPGLEPILEQELTEAGAEHLLVTEGGIRFNASEDAFYSFMLHSFVATSVELLLSSPADIRQTEVSTLAEMVKWTEIMPIHSVFDVKAFHNGKSTSALRILASELRNAIKAKYTAEFDVAPAFADEDNEAEFVFNIHIEDAGTCYLTLDAAGEPFAKRAVINKEEGGNLSPAMAAGIVKLSGWDGTVPLVDPYCNNGSILIEAARIAKKRTPAFEDDAFLMKKWRVFRHALWKKHRELLVPEIRKDVDWIYGSDKDGRRLSRVSYLLKILRLTENVRLKVSKANDIYYPKGPAFLLTAPPAETDLKLMGDFARKTKQFAHDYKIGIFSPMHNIDSVMGMKPFKTFKLDYDEREYSFMLFDVFKKAKPANATPRKFSGKPTFKKDSKPFVKEKPKGIPKRK